MSHRDVLVVVPTLDECQSIGELLAGIRAHVPTADVLVVDDGSTDGTAEIVERIARDTPSVRLLQRGRRLGIGTAYLEAFARGLREGYGRLVSMDGDLSHDPRYLPDLIAATADADVAIGSRYLHGVSVVNWGLERLALSVFANFCARVTTGLPVRDCTSGYQCFRREVLERIALASVKSTGYSFLVELKYRAHRLGFRLREVPIIFVDRRFGSSKLGPRHVLSSAWRLIDLRIRR